MKWAMTSLLNVKADVYIIHPTCIHRERMAPLFLKAINCVPALCSLSNTTLSFALNFVLIFIL